MNNDSVILNLIMNQQAQIISQQEQILSLQEALAEKDK